MESDLIRLRSTPTKELRHDIYRCITVNHFTPPFFFLNFKLVTSSRLSVNSDVTLLIYYNFSQKCENKRLLLFQIFQSKTCCSLRQRATFRVRAPLERLAEFFENGMCRDKMRSIMKFSRNGFVECGL